MNTLSESVCPTVFVVDDDPEVRMVLEHFLRSAGYVVETFASALEFLRRPPYGGCGCLVLDIQMPGMTGLELQLELAKADYHVPIVFLTGHADIPMCVTAMRKGAVDFMTKPVEREELLATVHGVVEKHRKRRVEHHRKARLRACMASLTARERVVMAQVITGTPNKVIAVNLGIAEVTVKVHRGRIMKKLSVASAVELARMVGSSVAPTEHS